MFLRSVNFAQMSIVCGNAANSKPCPWRKSGIKQGNYVFASAAYQAVIEVQHAGEAGVVQLMDVVPTIIVCYTLGYRKRHIQGFQWIITPKLHQMQKQSATTVPHPPETAWKGNLD